MKTANRRPDAGMTMIEVVVATLILGVAIVPLLLSLGDARRRVSESRNRRVMKQLLDFKLAQCLLDQPTEDKEPIYVDGYEGNFGDEFENDSTKAYFFDERLFQFAYRLDSEEVDLGSGAGLDDDLYNEDEPLPSESDPESPFGAMGDEEDPGQLRYRVTLTVFYHAGNARWDKYMSIVTYVKHPYEDETMSGPDASGAGGLGGGAGGGGTDGAAGSTRVGGGTSVSSGNQRSGGGTGDKGGGR